MRNDNPNKEQSLSQKKMIREYLMSGKSITPIDALQLFGCFRLATRVFELKEEGMPIVTTMIESNGKRFASYSLKTM
jgi:hypothetical protein